MNDSTQLARRITNETQRSVEVLPADLNDPTDLARIEDKLRSDASITMLVNNAGTAAVTPLANSNVNQLQSMIDLDVTALVRPLLPSSRGLIARRSGAIINISSGRQCRARTFERRTAARRRSSSHLVNRFVTNWTGQGLGAQVVLPGATATDLWSIAGKPVEQLPQRS